MKTISYWLGVVILGLALGLALQFARAWTEPAAAPPGGNLGAPLNTGDLTQVKSGTLGINSNGNPVGLSVMGNVGIGTGNPSALLTVVAPSDGPWAISIKNNSSVIRGLDIVQSNSGPVQMWSNYPTGAQLTLSPGGNIGIGTGDPLQRLHVSGGKAQADDFCLNSDPAKCLSSGSGNCRMVSGQVNSDGTVAKGIGFTSTRFGTGAYRVTFNQAFSVVPIVLANNYDPVVGDTNDKWAAGTNGKSTTQAEIDIHDMNGFNVNSGFYFMAMVPCQ